MFQKGNARQVWFTTFLAGGVFLALVLLAQTVSTYVYVSGNLVRQEALGEAGRLASSLDRAVRRAGNPDQGALAGLLRDRRAGSEGRIAWLRVIGPDGRVLSTDGPAEGDPMTFGRFRQAIGEPGASDPLRETGSGMVLVSVSPIRLSSSPSRGPLPAVGLLEVAVDVDSLSAGFVYLRANLVIGVSAALALLGTLLLIRLRFPHYLRGKQLEIQVEMARRVQADLLPTSQPRSREADIASICQPAWHAGGDFYDAFDTDGDRLALILGDVSGKGIAAAPLMGFIHGAAHASAWTESGYDHETASRRLNDLLFRKTALDRFVSMFWGYFDRDASMLRYINAGHLPALLLRGGPLGVETTRLTEGGPVLGVVPGASYTQGTVQVEPGDVLLVFSDGIAEALNAADDEFGEKRIIDAAVHAWRGSAEDIRDRVVSEVRAFTRGREANDDRTLVVMRFEHAPAAGCEEAPDAVYA